MNGRRDFYIQIVGDEGVGKSTLLRHINQLPKPDPNKFSEERPAHPMIKTSTVTVNITPEGESEPIQLTIAASDTRHVPDMIIYACELDDMQSISKLQRWRDHIDKKYGKTINAIIVGCNADLPTATPHNKQMASDMADGLGCRYWEISAKNNVNIESMLRDTATQLSTDNSISAYERLRQQHQRDNDQLEKSLQECLSKLKQNASNTSYQSIADLAKDIETINKSTALLETPARSTEREFFRLDLANFLGDRLSILLKEWGYNDNLTNELKALKKIKEELKIIQPKPSQPNKTKRAMLIVEQSIQMLTMHTELNVIRSQLLAGEGDNATPRGVMLLLAKATHLNSDEQKAFIKQHLIKEITEESERHPLIAAMKILSDEERHRLKSRLIDFTEQEIYQSTSQKTDAYEKLLKHKDTVNNPIPLIAILRISASGKPNAKTANYDKWLARMNKSMAPTKKSWGQTFFKEGVEGLIHKGLSKQKEQSLKPGGDKRDKLEEHIFPLEGPRKKK